MTDAPALLPCPFCGNSQAEVKDYGNDQLDHAAWCSVCGAHGPNEVEMADAVAAWNRRAAPPAAAPVEVHVTGTPDMPAETREALAQMIGIVVRDGLPEKADSPFGIIQDSTGRETYNVGPRVYTGQMVYHVPPAAADDVELVAKAMAEAWWESEGGLIPQNPDFALMARAAIAAMSKPADAATTPEGWDHARGVMFDASERRRIEAERNAANKRWEESETYLEAISKANASAQIALRDARALAAKLRTFVEWACDWFECEGFTHQPAAIEDCHGEKCRRPQCVACFGDHAYTSKEAQSDIGVQVETARAALAACRAVS